MSDKIDLSLVPVNELMGEVESRCVNFLGAIELLEDTDKQSRYFYGGGTQGEAIRLVATLNNNVLNDWRGELRTLREINDDE